jgi:hypothetical protein
VSDEPDSSPAHTEEEEERARALAHEVFRLLARKGGHSRSRRKVEASKQNLKRARWKRYHPHEPYQE